MNDTYANKNPVNKISLYSFSSIIEIVVIARINITKNLIIISKTPQVSVVTGKLQCTKMLHICWFIWDFILILLRSTLLYFPENNRLEGIRMTCNIKTRSVFMTQKSIFLSFDVDSFYCLLTVRGVEAGN